MGVAVMAERAVEPLSDEVLQGLVREFPAGSPAGRAVRELQALRAATWDVLTIEPDWGESHQRLRALLPAARVQGYARA